MEVKRALKIHLQQKYVNIFHQVFPPLTYFDFMQFDQKVGQYHLKGTDAVVTKSDFL